MPQDHTYPVEIRHIFVSPGHNYFGKPKDGPGHHPTHDVAEVEGRAGLGLVGDRYYGVPAHYEAQVTFIVAEVLEEVGAALGKAIDPILARRNIVIAGVPLNQLMGEDFSLEWAGESVRFAGVKQAAPCAWMDAMIGEGAQELMRGRGGLRVRVLTDGLIRRGPALLHSAIPLNVERITTPLARPALP
jgi:MOSC domain-containing protein YiiM